MRRVLFVLVTFLILLIGCPAQGIAADKNIPEPGTPFENPAQEQHNPSSLPPTEKPYGGNEARGAGEEGAEPENVPREDEKESPAGEEKEIQEEAGVAGKIASFVAENKYLLPMAGMILALGTLSGWLLYDRKKRIKDYSNKENTIALDDTLKPVTNSPMPRMEPPPVFHVATPNLRVGNLHNIGKRSEQQDSFCLSDIGDETALQAKGALAVVADGMGGMEGGAAISQKVTDIYRESYAARDCIEDTAVFLYETAQAAEKFVDEYMQRTGVEGGSTLVAVMVKGDSFNFLSVGDSRIYLWRNHNLKQLNREHNYGELLKDKAAKGEVAPDEPYMNPRRHALTAYIGKGRLNLVDRSDAPLPLAPGDKIFLCSDGVYNALGDDALSALLAGSALSVAQAIEREVLRQDMPKQDNFTGIVLEYVG